MKRTIFLMLAVLLSTLSAFAGRGNYRWNGIEYDTDVSDYTARVAEDGYYVGSIIIPSRLDLYMYTVVGILNRAFFDCSRLTSISIPPTLRSIGTDAFKGCTGLTTVTFNAEDCYSPRESSGAWFIDSPLTTLIIGDKVRSIPNFIAYNQAGLKTLSIGNSVTAIGYEAFRGCKGLTSATLPNTVIKIGQGAFEGCAGLTSISIPDCVSDIGVNAFKGCTGLTSISIPYCITEISANVFEGCTGLTSLTIPKLVTKIGEGAFKDCTGLTSVTIPNSVTNISGKAFEGCTGLARVFSYNPEPPVIAEDTFSSYDACLFVPKGCVSKYKEAEYWKNFKSIKETYVENIDINGDGMIDMVDVTSLINMILDQ